MTARTICLDPDPSDWQSRKIHVEFHRWYAKVELNRDGHVDAANALGRGSELPAAYIEAVQRARSTSSDRIWYDGYPGEFAYGDGPR